MSTLNNAVAVLQKLVDSAQKPESAQTLADRMITAINTNLKGEGKPIISDYDALRNIRSDLSHMIEQDRMGNIVQVLPTAIEFPDFLGEKIVWFDA